MAVASSDGKYVNQHFGHAGQFLIFDVDRSGNYEFLELRENVPSCKGGEANESSRMGTLQLIKDCDAVIVSRIGEGAVNFLVSNGIKPFMMTDFIDNALRDLAVLMGQKDKKGYIHLYKILSDFSGLNF
ncbi:NifB/NifX family molybdenum-iron cluster-binding protein [Methanobacterium aggregans]|uniref:NifB/NifX family molybdenum-iron cluster-binding protein n=2 Tax=Methanobacterium aggregans TaxID=1615586 RepID=UPI00321127AC